MDFGSEMLSVDHANISQRDIGNNRCISWEKRKFFQSRDCMFIRYNNFCSQRGLRIGPIQRMGAAPEVIHTGRFFVLIPLEVVGKINRG